MMIAFCGISLHGAASTNSSNDANSAPSILLALTILPKVLDEVEGSEGTRGLTEQMVQEQADGMGGEFCLHTRAEAREGLGVVALDLELASKLCIECFDRLAQGREVWQEGMRDRISGLICPFGREQDEVIAPGQKALEGSVEVGFVSQDRQSGVLDEELLREITVGAVCRDEGKIEDDPRLGGQEMEFESIEGLLLRRVVAIGGLPVPPMTPSRVIEADNGDRQAVDAAEGPLAWSKTSKKMLEEGDPQPICDGGEAAATAIIPRALGQRWEERRMIPSQIPEKGAFLILPREFGDQREGDYLALTARTPRSRAMIMDSDRPLVQVVDEHVDKSTDIREAVYHGSISCAAGGFDNFSIRGRRFYPILSSTLGYIRSYTRFLS